MKHVALCLGDVGSVENAVPVLSGLKQRYNLTVFIDDAGAPRAREILGNHTPYHVWKADEPFDASKYDGLIVGTNGKARKLQTAATAAGRAAVRPTIWLEDFEGTAAGGPKEVEPSAVTFFSEVGEQAFFKARRGFDGSHDITGNPSFDVLAEMRKEADAVKWRVRDTLQIRDEESFFAYFASSSAQFNLWDEAVDPLISWATTRDVKLYVGFHPADPRNQPLEGGKKGELSSRVEKELGYLWVDASKVPQNELLVAADGVGTDYSTVCFRAVTLGTSSIFLLGESAQKYQREKAGLQPPYFSILGAGGSMTEPTPAIAAYNQEDFSDMLDAVMWNDALRANMRRALDNPRYAVMADGYAHLRVLKFVTQVIG